MFIWRTNRTRSGEIYDWLLANKNDILSGTANYMGTPVNETTEFHQYKYVISCPVITVSFYTQHFLPTASNAYLRFVPWKYTLISLLLGWWCFPWGPPATIHAFFFNRCGGDRRTAASLLQLVEWGWDAPHDASVSAHKKKILEVSAAAATEIRSRMAKSGFSEEHGVRITPTKWADSEVEITFDYPTSDGRDWVDESDGLLVLIDKNDEWQLLGRRIDFADGTFSANMAPGATPGTLK